ncbi:transcription termination factor 4, mitochondrial isoform 1-T3 [Cochliomyia hominivorax]
MLRNIIIKIHQNTTKIKIPLQTRNFSQTTTCGKASTAAEHTATVPDSDYELKKEHIEEAIKTTPTLANVSPEMWQRAHETFLNHGITTNNFFQIVTGNPKILMRSPRKIIDTLEHWRSCQFGEYFLFLLITKYPFLMDVDDKRRLLKQISFLQSYVSTSKNVWKLLMNCPTLIEQTESAIEAKILYIKEKMRIEIPEIVKSEALSKSLDEIRCRHVFLERLGLFKPRPLKADPNEPSKNPRLYKITDTSEKTFATKVCHVTLAEYEAFKELYARELERMQEEENEEDDLLSDEEN